MVFHDDYYVPPAGLQAPTIRSTGGVFEFYFTDIRHHCRVDRLSTSTKHETMAEINIWSDHELNPGHVHRTRLNLTSGNTRKRMAEDLTRQVGWVKWGDFLEYICVMTLDKHRAGSEPVEIASMEMPDGIRWRLEPYLQENQATVMFGDGGSGKSWLALIMGYLIATGQVGWRMLPMQGNVLYLDYETDADTIWQRIDMLTAGLGEPLPEGFYYRAMIQTVANDVIEIAKIVLENSIDFIIIDSAAPATGEPESQAATTEYFRALRDLQRTTLTIAHVPKGGRSNMPFGSIFWRNVPRSNLRVYGQSEDGGFVSAIRHTKSNNGQLLYDRALRYFFMDGHTEVSEADPTEIDEMNREEDDGTQYTRVDLRQMIREALRDGARNLKELETATGRSRSAVEKTLTRNGDLFMRITQPQAGRPTFWGLRNPEDAR